MPETKSSLRQYFDRYAQLASGSEPSALAALYAPTFIIAGPNGSEAFTNDNRVLDWLNQVSDFNRRHGLRLLRPVAIEEMSLSPIHSLARVTWGTRFEKTGDRLITFDISYMLERFDDSWRILAYVSRNDQEDAMRVEGLL